MFLKIHVKYLCADILINTKSFSNMFPHKIIICGDQKNQKSMSQSRSKGWLLNRKEMVVTFYILIVLVEASLEISAYISLHILHFLVLKGESRENCI